MSPVAAIMLIKAFALAMYVSDRCKGIPTEEAATSVRNGTTNLALLILYLVFPSCATIVFSAFTCTSFELPDTLFEDTGFEPTTSYLTADLTISCESPYYEDYIQPYAIAMVLLYPVGVPLFFWVLLYTNRRQLYPDVVRGKTEEEIHDLPECQDALALRPRSIRFLYFAYEPRCYWFEIFECFRRLLLSSFLPVIGGWLGSTAQIAVAVCVSLVAIKTYGYYMPFDDVTDDYIAEITQWQFFAIIQCALLMQVAPASQEDTIGLVFLAIALVVVPLVFIMFAQDLLQLRSELKKEAQVEFATHELFEEEEIQGSETGHFVSMEQPKASKINPDS